MRPALVAVLLLAGTTTPAKLPNGFQSATWGMTQAQANKALSAGGPNNLAVVEVAGERGLARTYYSGGKLAYVTVSLPSAGPFEMICDLLTEKYGAPTSTDDPSDATERLLRGTTVEWNDGNTRIEVARDPLVVITYASVALEPAARRDEEVREKKAAAKERSRKLDSL